MIAHRMPGGMHRSKKIDDLPSSYLKLVAENWSDDEIAQWADEEHRWRTDHDHHLE